MTDPLRVLFLGEGDAKPVTLELRRGGRAPSIRCASVRAGMDAALDGQLDIVICHSVSGECGALEALRAIRARGLDLPVIVVSSPIADADVAAVLAAGAADHLTRGNLTRLNAAVARELHTAATRRERARLEDRLRQAEKMEAVGRLAAGLAHDVNNLLTLVAGYSDLLLGRRVVDESQRSALEEIRGAAQRGGELTHELLVFSHHEPVEVRAVSLNQLLLDTEGLLRRLVGEDIHLAAVLAGSPDIVECSPGRLEQVIVRLVASARDAMPGGGTLTIETGCVRVAKRASTGQLDAPPGRYVTLSVTDTGSGEDAETRRHLLEPFLGAGHRRKGGSGMAAAGGVSHYIGGAMSVSSEPGRGTTVTVYLPLAKDKGRPAKR